ncbi:transcription elongation factor GreA [Luteococcus japonicus]|uniref:Transcription elongation factor GreA n=2 Tax=Luteococcus japonicus TaxID=33984 RepID=A0A1R4KH28_9ACTN|nr:MULTISPECIES: transcription elongation factor GreA [Luteococcus]MDN5563413.1 transcription elongation factor GreA [Luteococcus sp.]ROR55475.1 transcription elongation factor GreA [Luteococcus japonicus]SJN43535.1 Transcription elongation factor GreA [Luteococcus japonicus LSP_Lj1]
MSENATDVVWLTQDAYDKLTGELEYLKGDGRTEVTTKIAQARDEGDLSENGGYHAAREEQGQMEARILQLEDILRRAKVGEAPKTGEAAPGTQVTVAYFGDEDDTDTFLLGSREVMGLDESVDIQVFSPQSPLGAAVLGKKVGESSSYEAPNGKTIEITVVKVENFQA